MDTAQDIRTIKSRYREFFTLAHNRLLGLFETERAAYSCTMCQDLPAVETILHAGCGYGPWQRAMIPLLEQTIGRQIFESLERIRESKEVKGGCHSCGMCCSLASSEFNYEALQQKAQNGDEFARQFTSIFLPYESTSVAQEKYPDVVNDILSQTAEDSVYFYYCPHLGADNLCTIYTDPRRPQICADYPATPLTLMHRQCGYQPWRTQELPTTLMAHAALELCQYYAHKILDAVKASG